MLSLYSWVLKHICKWRPGNETKLSTMLHMTPLSKVKLGILQVEFSRKRHKIFLIERHTADTKLLSCPSQACRWTGCGLMDHWHWSSVASSNGGATELCRGSASQTPLCSSKPLWWAGGCEGRSCEPFPSGHRSPVNIHGKSDTVGPYSFCVTPNTVEY